MPTSTSLHYATGRQFTLRSLFELMTLCGILAALTPSTGIAASASLMLLALGLHLRLGSLSLAALMAACMTAPLLTGAGSGDPYFGGPSFFEGPNDPSTRQFAIALAAAAICGWYWWRSAAEPIRT